MEYLAFLIFINIIFFITVIIGMINKKPFMDTFIFSLLIYILLNIILKLVFKIIFKSYDTKKVN